jgi:hypothetical protein
MSRARRKRRIRPKRDTITHRSHSTVHVVTAFGIINAVAVANIEAASAAVPPDRVLDEPREGRWKDRVELPGSIRVGACAADPFPGAVAGRAYFA